jgi:hypothetical protein
VTLTLLDLWVYDITNDKWSHLDTLQSEGTDNTESGEKLKPIPRFASQIVYSEKYDLHFLFGGNAGELLPPNERLDDLWIMKCEKPSIEQCIIRPLKLLLRKQKFLEMVPYSSMEALEYLRTNITSLINNENENDQKLLLSLTSSIMFPEQDIGKKTNQFEQRMECFEQIAQFFDPQVRAPCFPTVVSKVTTMF